MNLIQQLEAEAIEQFSQSKTIPEFRPGDTLRVGVKVVEGERTRIQNFEGVSRRAIAALALLHRPQDRFGEGVERAPALFPTSIRSSRPPLRPSAAPALLSALRTGNRPYRRARDTRHLDKAEAEAAAPGNPPSRDEKAEG